jgi:flagellar M-ring protein FliF
VSSTPQLSGTPGDLIKSGPGQQITAFVNGLTTRQKLLMAGSALLVIGTLAFFVTLMNKPDYKPLVSNLSTSDAQTLNAKLGAKGIKSQVTKEGTGVEVASEQLDKARLELAGDGMPSGGRMGYELFDKPNWMGSDFAEKVNYQRALEGELERTISSIQEVESARVHLVLQKESLFADKEKEAKAAVVLKLKRSLPPETANAITQLVANSVEGLNSSNVTLLSADGHVPLLPKKGFFGATDGDMEAALVQQIIATLEPVVGPDHVKANVRVEYDTATSDETRETYDPNSAVAITKQVSKEHTGSLMPGGIPGTATNVPSTTTATAVPKQGTTAADSGSSSESESATFAVNRVVKHVSQPAGLVKRISAAVLVDDGGKPRTPEELKKFESIASAALGIDSKRGDTLVVEGISFQVPKADTLVKPTAVDKVSKIVNSWGNVLRVGGVVLMFLLVYMLVLRPVKNQVMTTAKQLAERKPAIAVASETVDDETARSTLNMHRELVNRVKMEPEMASKLLQSWIHKAPEAGS